MKFGYVYKITNNITGEFYVGKRENSKDVKSHNIYMGSSNYIKQQIEEYGEENFTKTILKECDSSDQLFNVESMYIDIFNDDPKCINFTAGKGFGGVYQVGKCKNCGETSAIYSASGLCMSCIIGKRKKAWCDICGRETYRYKDGSCMSCVSKNSHETTWCEQCQKFTSHFGTKCKTHDYKLVKNGDKIELWNQRHLLVKDVDNLLENINVRTTPRSVIYDLNPETLQIKCNNKFVELRSLLYNENVSDWLKITYRYSGRADHTKSIIMTTDHPLPLLDGKLKLARNLVVGDKLIRTNIKNVGSGKQWTYAEIVKIEPYIQTARSYDVTTETEYFDINQDILSHNCRSFLTPYVDPETNKPKFYGRFNQGVVTINLIDVALSSKKNREKFWKIFDERLELCHRALRIRHERLRGTPSDVAPILWQYGALARLEKGETIDRLLYGGYSTISLGYVGLWETVYYLTGKKLTEEDGKQLGLEIMRFLNKYTAKWKAAENIDYSLYGTPIESTTYKFAKCLQQRFGIIPGVTDKDYVTNSYHVHVTEPIDAFSKLKLESEFQTLSPGGAISYVEVPNMQDNIPAVLSVIKFIYDNIMYAELNTKSDYCQVCGWDGEIKIVTDENGKLVWECPKCGNRDTRKMNVARRTCGYIGTKFWNSGRTEEIKERVLHL